MLLAALLAVPGTSLAQRNMIVARQPPPAMGCMGRWVGSARNGTGAPWTIVMDVSAPGGPMCGAIEYPSLGCGGMLINCVTRSGQSTFVEQYTHNPGTCAPDGTIVARCNGRMMQWTWVGQEVVRTTLVRQ